MNQETWTSLFCVPGLPSYSLCLQGFANLYSWFSTGELTETGAEVGAEVSQELAEKGKWSSSRRRECGSGIRIRVETEK